MITFTADFVPHGTNNTFQYQLTDNATVLDLKNAVIGDPPVTGQWPENLTVSTQDGAINLAHQETGKAKQLKSRVVHLP